ncbi:glycosyltransferase family 39 protein [Pilobolus umbonatus]|nr:glycosyltransferase family 39 protein [Pilobolus umbonatus]
MHELERVNINVFRFNRSLLSFPYLFILSLEMKAAVENTVRNRFKKKQVKKEDPVEFVDDMVLMTKEQAHHIANDKKHHRIANRVLVGLSVYITFYKIWFPSRVVFDEVHFGKFAGYYLQRTFFFDVHPPLAKLMLAAVGYMIGFDGVYPFSAIDDSYIDNSVPYIPLRALPATLNVFCTALVYGIMKESGYAPLACILSTSFYMLDNALIAHNRLILLDSFLLFFMLGTIYSYVQFRNHRFDSFSVSWWKWLLSTGIFMALTLSVKMVGLLLIMALGISVIMDLWDLIDPKNRLSLTSLGYHFVARLVALVVVPAVIYLSVFSIHFTILNASGPGDAYMSSRFQSTLKENKIQSQTVDIKYHQSIRLQHTLTKAYLYSHELKYPLRYEDGRISSQGQQVVGNMEADFGSYWKIIPTKPTVEDEYVLHGDIIQLEHVVTSTFLLTHDVASPWMPTNQEITTVGPDVRYNETLFKVVLSDTKNGNVWKTMMNPVKLVHVATGIAVWCNHEKLPDWGLYMLEVNGNKKSAEAKNEWIATDIMGINATEYNLSKSKASDDSMGFLEKFLEYQKLMIHHNNHLTAEHPFASRPLAWILMTRGISYWADQGKMNQIYMTGNIAGWWLSLVSLIVFSVVCLVDAAYRKRGSFLLNQAVRKRLVRSGGFFFLLWACHYFPFFSMNRSLYLHHYLPALVCSYLLLGTVFQLLFIQGVQSPSLVGEIIINQGIVTLRSYIVASILIGLQYLVYSRLSPITYGTPSLSPEGFKHVKLLDSWDVQFSD